MLNKMQKPKDLKHNSIVYLKTNTNYYICRSSKLWAEAFPPFNPAGEFIDLSGKKLEVFDHPTVSTDPSERVPFLLKRASGPGILLIDDIFYLETLERDVRSGVRYLAPRSREGPLSFHDVSSEVLFRPFRDLLGNSMSVEWNFMSRGSNGYTGSPVTTGKCYSMTTVCDPMDLVLTADHSRLAVIYPEAFLLNFEYDQVRWSLEEAGIISTKHMILI